MQVDRGTGCTPWTHTLNCDDYQEPATCAPQSMTFTNNCRYKIYLAVHFLLGNDAGLAAGYCAEGTKASGEWCTRAWFGADYTQSVLPFYSANQYYYYYAYAKDSKV